MPPGLERHEFEAMGTVVSVVLPEDLGELAEVARTIFDAWERSLSRFRQDSELTVLNRHAGEPIEVSDLLFRVASIAIAAAAATDGVYDPTMLRQLEGLGYDRTFRALPGNRRLPMDPIAPGGAWRQVELDPVRRTVKLPPGAGLDFGGIAKGMAVDEAVSAIVTEGATPVGVEAGGDLAVAGLPDGLDAWPVAVETLMGQRFVGLPHGALATSSIGRRRWRSGDLERHHLLDPRSGLPADTGVRSVTTAATSCRQAEVAAKVALILGPDDGIAFLNACDLSALVVLETGEERTVGRWSRWAA